MPSGLSRRAFVGSIGAIATGTVSATAEVSNKTHSSYRGSNDPVDHRASTSNFEAFFDERIPAQLDEHHLAGATVAVVAEGEVQFTKGYGYADVETENAVSADETCFPSPPPRKRSGGQP